MKPHKHAEIIKAWADGAEIEYKSDFITEWSDIKYPTWKLDHDYRVKPTSQKDISLWQQSPQPSAALNIFVSKATTVK